MKKCSNCKYRYEIRNFVQFVLWLFGRDSVGIKRMECSYRAVYNHHKIEVERPVVDPNGSCWDHVLDDVTKPYDPYMIRGLGKKRWKK